MAVDISSWPTKADVCQILGLSLSQVNNLIKQKRLDVRREKRFGAPPLGRINPKDVTREKELRQARDAQVHVMPAGASVPTTDQERYDATKAIMRDPTLTDAEALALLRAAGRARRSALLATMHEPARWLRYDEAVMYTGLGESRLRELVDAGQVRTDRGPHGSVVLRRADLDKL